MRNNRALVAKNVTSKGPAPKGKGRRSKLLQKKKHPEGCVFSAKCIAYGVASTRGRLLPAMPDYYSTAGSRKLCLQQLELRTRSSAASFLSIFVSRATTYFCKAGRG